ncbi:MAG: hypothetical protein II799_06945 [Lachnospiraceae bacterium]|nr:hypothetical protein [Lachnospiraceae bacterium]MCR4798510.1 hypothetical protein [Lachnospiraceae bacterium]
MAVLCYLFTWVGFIIAFVAGDRNDPYFKHHLNQALVLHLFSLIGLIPFIGWVWGIFMFVMYVLAVMSAIKETTEPVPVFGGIHLL